MTLKSAEILAKTYEEVLRRRGEIDKIYYLPKIVETANMILQLFGHKADNGQKLQKVNVGLDNNSQLTCSVKISNGDIVNEHAEFSKALTESLAAIRSVKMKDDELRQVKCLLSRYCDCDFDSPQITLKH